VEEAAPSGGEKAASIESELGPIKRVVLKLSGESLAGDGGYGIDPPSLDATANQVVEAVEAGAELAVVVGGGTSSAARRLPTFWHRERDGRLHGDARDRNKRPSVAGGLGEARHTDAGPVGRSRCRRSPSLT
jgi:hypothetical protein